MNNLEEGTKIEVVSKPPTGHLKNGGHFLVLDPVEESMPLSADYFGTWQVDDTINAAGGEFPGRINLVIRKESPGDKVPKLFVKLAYSDGGGGEEFSRVRRHIEEEVENLRHINKLEPSDDSSITKVGHVAKIVAQATFYRSVDSGYTLVPALIEKHVKGDDLEEWMKKWWKSSLDASNAITSDANPPELGSSEAELSKERQAKILKLWSILAFATSNIVRRIHNRGVIHGWIQPRHIILSEPWNELDPANFLNVDFNDDVYVGRLLSGVHLVGFGTSAIVFDPDKGDDAKRLMKDEVFAAPELRNSGTIDGIFSYPVELFSLGALLLYIAVGLAYPFNQTTDEGADETEAKTAGNSTPPESEARTEDDEAKRKKKEAELEKHLEIIRKTIHDQIRAVGGGTVAEVKKSVANTLKAYGWPTEALARVIDKAMRKDQEDRYLCAEEMMQFILNLVDNEEKKKLLSHILPGEGTKEVRETLDSVLDPTSKHKDKPSGFLGEFFGSRVGETCAWQGLSAFSKSPHFEVYGSRDLLLDWLCSFMSYLQPGDEYYTRTILPYWTDDNLGSTGRFLVKNKDLVMQGVKVKRIFIVAHDFADLPIDEQMALVGQRDMIEELAEKTPRKSFEVRIRRAENLSKLMQVERRHQLVAFVKRRLSPLGEKPERFDYFGFSFMSRGQRYREFDESYLRATITKLRFRHLDMEDEDDRSAVEQFDATWRGDSVPLDEYLNYGVPLETLLTRIEK